MCFLFSELCYYNGVILASLSYSLGRDNCVGSVLAAIWLTTGSSLGRAVALKRAAALDLSRSIEITRDLRAIALKLAEALNLNCSS